MFPVDFVWLMLMLKMQTHIAAYTVREDEINKMKI